MVGLKHRHTSRTPTPLLYQVLLCGLYLQIPVPRSSSRLMDSGFSSALIRGSLGVRVEQQSIPSGRPVQATPCPETRAQSWWVVPTSFGTQHPPQPQCPWKTPVTAPWAAPHTPDDRGGDLCTEEHAEGLPPWEANMPTMEKAMENLSLTLSLIPGGEPAVRG